MHTLTTPLKSSLRSGVPTARSWLLAGALLVAAGCASPVGGGGGFAATGSGGLAGTPCTPAVHGEGCLTQTAGPTRMQCDSVTNTWLLIEICAAGTVCVEIPGSANPNVKTTQCLAPVSGQDAATSSDTAMTDVQVGDAPTDDGGLLDAGATLGDGGVMDTGAMDTAGSTSDTGGSLSDVADTWTPDTWTPDTSTPDTSSPDTWTPDTWMPDTAGDGGPTGPVCGNGTCEVGETQNTCPKDCAVSKPDSCVGNCGKKAPAGCYCDSQCTGSGDCCGDYKTICAGTSTCGNGKCDAGETQVTCAQDCKPAGPVCGDGKCDATETKTSCAKDCGTTTDPKSCKGICGNKAASGCYCDSKCVGSNDCCSDYQAECGGSGGPVCGDGKCDVGETCAKDCSTSSACPNGKCEAGETETSCPQDCKKCFGDFTLGSTFYKSNDTSQVGAACSPKGAPKNCPDGYWVTFNDTSDCVCVVSCSAFSKPLQLGQACNTSGSWVCKNITNFKGTSSGKFCVATKWGLCEK